jgi:hypothetical protein
MILLDPMVLLRLYLQNYPDFLADRPTQTIPMVQTVQ